MTEMIPVAGMPSAPHLDIAGEIRRATGLPTFHASRIQDVATARYAIAAGHLDMVGMTRAHMADPHIVRKIQQGREETIRPCTGANYCLDRIYQGGMALCIHNAATGRKETMPHVISRAVISRRVVIVGAGPGGLATSLLLAQSGIDVTIIEKEEMVGGRTHVWEKDGYRFDNGPTFFHFPEVIEEIFQAIGGCQRPRPARAVLRAIP